MKIRKAKKGDLKEIAEIFRVETTKEPYIQDWNKKTALEKIKELFKEQDIFIVALGDKIAGFITIEVDKSKKKIYIDELWLRAEYQGKGIGTNLMNFAEDYYKKIGIKTITVMANQKARAVEFYEKLNYKVKHKFIYFIKKI